MNRIIPSLIAFFCLGYIPAFSQVYARMAWGTNLTDITIATQELPLGNILFFSYNQTGIHALKTDADLQMLDHRHNPLTDFYISDVNPFLYKNSHIYLLALPMEYPISYMDIMQFDTNGVLEHRLRIGNLVTEQVPKLFGLEAGYIGIIAQDSLRGGFSVIKIPTDLGSVIAGNLDAWNYSDSLSLPVASVSAGSVDMEMPVLGAVRFSESSNSLITLQQVDANMDVVDGREWVAPISPSGVPLSVLALPGNRMMAAYRHVGFQYEPNVSPNGSAFALLPDSFSATGWEENNGRFLLNYYMPFHNPERGITLWEETDTVTRQYSDGAIYRNHFGAGQLYGASASVPEMEAETFAWDEVEVCHTLAGTRQKEPLPYVNAPSAWSKLSFFASAQPQAVMPATFQAYPSVTYLCSAAHLGMEEHLEPKVNLYPNPAVSFVRLESEIPVSWVEISDVTGKCVYRGAVVDNFIPVQTLASGAYVFRLHVSGNIVLKKVLLAKE